MKTNVKGLVIAMALVVPLVLGQCSDANDEVVEQTMKPLVYDNIAVKTAHKQGSIKFYLTVEYIDAEWKIYPEKTGEKSALNMSVTYDIGAVLVLTNSTGDIYPGDYWVAVTEPGKTESERLKLTVREQAKTPSPETSISSVAKTDAVQKSVTFYIDNAEVYTAADWKLAQTAGIGVMLTVNGEILTLSHSTDVPVGTYYVSVTDEGKSESERLRLTVTAFVAGYTPVPLPNPASFTKTALKQPSVAFQMANNTYFDPTWKLYGTYAAAIAGKGYITNVTTSYSDNILTLHSSPDVSAGIYYVTATDGVLKESAPAKLTVNEYEAPPTLLPAADGSTIIAKTTPIQTSVVVKLSNSTAYPSNTTW